MFLSKMNYKEIIQDINNELTNSSHTENIQIIEEFYEKEIGASLFKNN